MDRSAATNLHARLCVIVVVENLKSVNALGTKGHSRLGWKPETSSTLVIILQGKLGGNLDDISYDTIQVQSGVVYLQPATDTVKGLLKRQLKMVWCTATWLTNLRSNRTRALIFHLPSESEVSLPYERRGERRLDAGSRAFVSQSYYGKPRQA